MPNGMLYEDYLRRQASKGDYGVCIISVDAAESIADWIGRIRALRIAESSETVEPVSRWKTPVGASWRSAVFTCEKCSGKVYWPQAMRGEKSNKRRCYYPMCPWCGAKMEVEAGDQ